MGTLRTLWSYLKPRPPRVFGAAPCAHGLTPTPDLRWAVTRYDKARGLQGELQQKWVTAEGSIEWRAVPRVLV